jgi:hypothetical protein
LFQSPAGQVQSLDDGASAEGFLDRLLGTACYSRAVDELHADCRTLGQDTKSRLALQVSPCVLLRSRWAVTGPADEPAPAPPTSQLVNCQLATHGTEAFTCGASESLKVCTERLPDRVWTLYVEFLSHIDRWAGAGPEGCRLSALLDPPSLARLEASLPPPPGSHPHRRRRCRVQHVPVPYQPKL